MLVDRLRENLVHSASGVYGNNRTLVHGDVELDQAGFKALLDDKLGEVLAALNTLQLYRQELSRMNDPDYQREAASEEAAE